MTNDKARDLLSMIEVKEPNELIVNSWWGSFAKDYKEALEIAITALEIQEKIKKIIYIDNMIIQEDVMKYKMICEVMK